MFDKVIVGFDGSEHARDALALRAAACAVLVVPPSKSSDVAGSVRLSPAISSAHGS
jgi:hypothetical protein